MIIVMKPHAPEEAVKRVAGLVQEKGLETHLSQGKEVTIIGVVGDKTKLSNENLTMLPWVDKLVPITESYKLSNRKFHPEPSRVKIKDHEIGPDTLTIMAGPCAVENEEQLMTIAREVKKSGAQFVRAAPTSPGPPPILFRGWRKRACATWRKPERNTICAPSAKSSARRPLRPPRNMWI